MQYSQIKREVVLPATFSRQLTDSMALVEGAFRENYSFHGSQEPESEGRNLARDTANPFRSNP